MFITNNTASFNLCGKETLLKHQKVSKFYENDCRKTVTTVCADLFPYRNNVKLNTRFFKVEDISI